MALRFFSNFVRKVPPGQVKGFEKVMDQIERLNISNGKIGSESLLCIIALERC